MWLLYYSRGHPSDCEGDHAHENGRGLSCEKLKMAADQSGSGMESDGWQSVELPAYLREVDDMRFVNVSIKNYERKTSSGFPREEYFAYRVVSM